MKPANLFRVFHLAAVFLAAVPALSGFPQTLDAGMPMTRCLEGLETQSGYGTRYRAIRAFEDPGTHQHWLLIRDQNRVTGPALLVKAQHAACVSSTLGKMNSESKPLFQLRSIPVIHAGDRIVLLEHSAVSDAELEATALQAAAVGDPLPVRLKFGGLTVRAIAAAPGYVTVGNKTSERLP
jgi:hypothetical protein